MQDMFVNNNCLFFFLLSFKSSNRLDNIRSQDLMTMKIVHEFAKLRLSCNVSILHFEQLSNRQQIKNILTTLLFLSDYIL